MMMTSSSYSRTSIHSCLGPTKTDHTLSRSAPEAGITTRDEEDAGGSVVNGSVKCVMASILLLIITPFWDFREKLASNLNTITAPDTRARVAGGGGWLKRKVGSCETRGEPGAPGATKYLRYLPRWLKMPHLMCCVRIAWIPRGTTGQRILGSRAYCSR